LKPKEKPQSSTFSHGFERGISKKRTTKERPEIHQKKNVKKKLGKSPKRENSGDNKIT
jgi:hypothetical protein